MGGRGAVVPLLTRMKAKSDSLTATVANQLDMDKKTKVVQHRAGLVSDKQIQFGCDEHCKHCRL